MGKIVKINSNLIQPSQSFLKEDTVLFIIACLVKGDTAKLPPTPIVRHDPLTNSYIAIDGHNLIAVHELLNKECLVYVAEYPEDKLPREVTPASSEEAINKRNQDLVQKFEKVINEVKELQSKGVRSFHDLTNKYPDLIHAIQQLDKI